MQVALDDYSWAGGLATELVNTLPGVWSGVDKLPDPATVERFVAEHAGPGGPTHPELAALARDLDAADLDAVHAVRDRVRAVFDRPEHDSLVAAGTALTGPAGGATLRLDDAGRTRWALVLASGGSLADALALVCGVGVLGVVHALGPERFRPCDAETCSGVFIDTSRPGRRRYCMPELCGNRVNVAAHRARRSGGRPG